MGAKVRLGDILSGFPNLFDHPFTSSLGHVQRHTSFECDCGPSHGADPVPKAWSDSHGSSTGTADTGDNHTCSASGPECFCKEGYRCITKKTSGKWILGCPNQDHDETADSIATDSFNSDNPKCKNGGCVCVPNAFPTKHDVERGRIHGHEAEVEVRYPLLRLTESFVQSVKNGTPVAMPKKEWLTAAQWTEAFEAKNGGRGVKSLMQEILDHYHTDVKKVTQVLDGLEKNLRSADAAVEGDDGAGDDKDGGVDLDDDAMEDHDQDAVLGLNQAVNLGMTFQNMQQNCKNVQTIAMKIDPDHARGGDGELNCYLDFNEKKSMKKLWDEIGDVTQALKEDSVFSDEWALRNFAASGGGSRHRVEVAAPHRIRHSAAWRREVSEFLNSPPRPLPQVC